MIADSPITNADILRVMSQLNHATNPEQLKDVFSEAGFVDCIGLSQLIYTAALHSERNVKVAKAHMLGFMLGVITGFKLGKGE